MIKKKKKINKRSFRGVKRWRKTRLKQASPMEKEISNFLTECKVKFEREWIDPTLVNDKTNCPLFIDFYLPEYNAVIEYHGKQHYISENKKKLKEQQHRDKVKKRWCKKNGIRYLEIHYMSQSRFKELIIVFVTSL